MNLDGKEQDKTKEQESSSMVIDDSDDDDDTCEMSVVYNDGKDASLLYLYGLKQVISQQLPNMPKSYILRIVMDRKHRAVCAVKKGKVIGGCVYRPFFDKGFGEIVFLAITEVEKRRSYGSRVINFMKEHVKTQNIYYFLTFADNLAIKFFKKHGFIERSKQGKDPWKGFYKEYVESTLMECAIDYSIDYSRIKYEAEIKTKPVNRNDAIDLSALPVYPGIPEFFDEQVAKVSVRSIPGVMSGHLKAIHTSSHLQSKLGYVLKKISAMKDTWPFRKPVRKEDVPDYYTLVQTPMALSIIRQKFNDGEYHTKEEFVHDFRLIFANCRRYNHPDTVYCQCAKIVETRFNSLMQRLEKWESHLEEMSKSVSSLAQSQVETLESSSEVQVE